MKIILITFLSVFIFVYNTLNDELAEILNNLTSKEIVPIVIIAIITFLLTAAVYILLTYFILKLNKAIDKVLGGDFTAKEAVLTEPGPVCKMFRRDHIQQKEILFDQVQSSNDVMFVVKATCWAANDGVTVSNEVIYVITSRKNSLYTTRGKDPRNYLCRLDVRIRRNKFYDENPYTTPQGDIVHYEKTPIIVQVLRTLKFGPTTFCKAIVLAIRQRALFSGTSIIFKKVLHRSTAL